MPFKNTAITYTYIAWDTANNVGKTGDGGNHTISGSRDGTQFTPTDTTPTEIDSTNLKGVYSIDLSAAENNGVLLMMGGESSTGNIVIIPVSWSNEVSGSLTHVMGTILTEGGAGRLAAAFKKLFDVVTPVLVASDVMVGTANAATAANLATVADYIDTEISTLLTRLSAARAGYLDNLSAGAVALASGVNVTSEANIDFGALKKSSLNAATPNLAAITGDKDSYKATGFSTHDAAAVKTAIEAGGSILALIKAVTDNLPNSGALSDIATNAARLTAVRAAVLTDWINGERLDLLLDAVNTVVPDAAGTAPTAAEIKTAIEAGGSSLAQILAAVKTNAAGTDIAADIIALKTVADAIKVVTDLLADSATTLISGTVSYDNTNATTTVFYCDDITEATADHYKGREVIFLTAALFRQATDITAYALVSGEGKFTVTALTEAPPDNCTFVIV